MTYASEVAADSPVLWWRLGESSGTTAFDSSAGGTHDGTYIGSPTLGVAGIVAGSDTAVGFDDVNDRISYSGTILSATSTASFEIWLKTTPGAITEVPFDLSGSNSANLFIDATGVFTAFVNASGSGSRTLTGPTINDGVRHHIVVTVSGGTMTLYVDGSSYASGSVSGTLSINAVAVGSNAGGTNLSSGVLDEFAIYNTALSGARVAAHFAAGDTPPDQTVIPTLIASDGGMFAPIVLQPPTGTVISRRIGRRLTSSPQVRVGGVWLATVGAAGDLVVKHKRNGCYEATWSMALGRQERPPCLVKGAPVEVYYGPLLVWTGTLDAPDWNAGTFAAIGSAREGEGAKCLTGAGVVTSKPNTAINAAITRGVVSWTRVGDFGTDDLSGVEGDGSNDDPDIEGLNGLLDVWATENDSQWYVTPDRQLIIRPEDENAPKWFILPGTVVLGVAADDVTDRVFLRYRSSVDDYLRTVSYPASTPVGGIERSASIAKRGRMSSARATTIATAMYRRLQAGRTGWTNGIDAHHGQIIDKGGLVANLSLIRGGDTVRVLDHPDPRGVVRHVDLVIGEVTWTPDDNRVQLNPVGLAARTWESVMKQSRALAINGPEYSFETTY